MIQNYSFPRRLVILNLAEGGVRDLLYLFVPYRREAPLNQSHTSPALRKVFAE